jgi:hypothetical protein
MERQRQGDFDGSEEAQRNDWREAEEERAEWKLKSVNELPDRDYSKCQIIRVKNGEKKGIVIGKPGGQSRKYLIRPDEMDNPTIFDTLQPGALVNVERTKGKYLITTRVQEFGESVERGRPLVESPEKGRSGGRSGSGSR